MLVRIERCGVCHSDLHMQDGYFALGEGKNSMSRAGRTLPFTLGHEIAGVVERAGPDAARRHSRPQGRGLSLDRLRPVRGLPGRRGKSLPEQPPSRRLGRRRLCLARAGAASALLIDYAPLPPSFAGALMCSGLTAYSALKRLPQAMAVAGGAAVATGQTRACRSPRGRSREPAHSAPWGSATTEHSVQAARSQSL